MTKILLSNDRYALFSTVILMLIPYSAWLGLSVLALVTLRKGWQAGFMLLIPAITAHTVLALMSVTWGVGLLDAMLRIIPVYLAACVLRFFGYWQSVALFFLLVFFLLSLSLHLFFPHWIEVQLMMLKNGMNLINASSPNALTPWEVQGISSEMFAHLLLGIQSVFLLIMMLIPLFFARSLQAKLYYPGGFTHELLNFRGDKYLVLGLLVSSIGAYCGYPLALSSLPLFLFYFVCTGVSLSAYALSKRKPFKRFLLLFIPLILLPWMVAPAYLVLGLLDSFYNCRWYLSYRGKK